MPNLRHKLLSTTYSEIWLTGLEKTPLDRCQPQLAPYKRRIYDINVTLIPFLHSIAKTLTVEKR